ncbi:MAG: hypothetical protein NZ959_02725 [Armatimonadetes bacterium]|nr:hypothetical protein [Armatimonadota bacterium]MDW8121506.1 hypothetical protein [Armatimonadota bacterium]
MEKVLELLNEMEEKGLIARYAIGGGLAVLFYTQPFFTEDVNAFIAFPRNVACNADPSQLDDFFHGKGYETCGTHLTVDDWLVQLVSASTYLDREAVLNAREVTFGSQKGRVLTPEYLIAVKLALGRPKDLAHIALLIEQAEINRADLNDILTRFGLRKKWQEFAKRTKKGGRSSDRRMATGDFCR